MSEVGPAKPGELNYAAVDGFTFIHSVMGFMMGHAGAGAVPTLMASLLWENMEPRLKKKYPYAFPSESIDTTRNKVADTAAWMTGWWLSRKVK